MVRHRRAGVDPEKDRSGLKTDICRAESRTFRLELVRNHSCSSLANDSLARLFVRPGGAYHGVSGSYVPCPTGTDNADSLVMRNLPEDPSKLHSAGFTRATTKKT